MKSFTVNYQLSIIFLIVTLFAQSALGQIDVKLGATAGLNFASIFEEDEISDLKTGFRGGAVADFGLHKNFSVVPELLFSRRGWKYIGEDNDN
jgi:hypothetical protein